MSDHETIHCLDGLECRVRVVVADEAEATRAACDLVDHDAGGDDLTEGREHLKGRGMEGRKKGGFACECFELIEYKRPRKSKPNEKLESHKQRPGKGVQGEGEIKGRNCRAWYKSRFVMSLGM